MPHKKRNTGFPQRREGTIPKPHRGPSIETSDMDYTPDEWEFANAADTYQRARRRTFLGRSDLLHVLLALGYRKVAEPMTVAEARAMHHRPVYAEAN